MSRSLAMALLAALLWCVAAPVRAERRVLVRLASDDPLSAAIVLELRWRGAAALVDAPEGDGDDRAYRSLVMAQLHGADAAVWIDEPHDGQLAVVHAVRTEDGLEASSPIPARSLRTELRETALIAALLVDELFGLTALAPRCATSVASAGGERDRARELGPPGGDGGARMYFAIGTGWFGSFDRWWPGFAGHVSLGAEWSSGLRVGVAAAVRLIWDRKDDESGGYAASFEGPLPVGGVEVMKRWDEGAFVLFLGGRVLGGASRQHVTLGAWELAAMLMPGASVGIAFPVGDSGEIGLRGDVDLWIEERRSPAPTLSLSIEWGWH